MSGKRRVPAPAAAVGLATGSLPGVAATRAALGARWPGVRVGVVKRRGETTAERSLGIVDGADRIDAGHFPWPLSVGSLAFPEHASHVWLSVRHYDAARRSDALRLLARATAAVAQAGDAVFVWWSAGDRVMQPHVFVASAGEQA